jgi:hypothetical protein
MQNDEKTTTPERLMARVLRDVLASGAMFETSSELKAALRSRCQKLGIPRSEAVLDRAVGMVGSNHRLITPPRRIEKPVQPRIEAPPPSQVEAARILAGLGIDVRGSRLTRVVEQVAPSDFPQLIRVDR